MSEYDRLAAEATPRPWIQGDGAYGNVGCGYQDDMGVFATDNNPRNDDSDGQSAADAALIVALVNAAPDIERLWNAAEERCRRCRKARCIVTCNRCGDRGECDLRPAVEALRPLFGEE